MSLNWRVLHRSKTFGQPRIDTGRERGKRRERGVVVCLPSEEEKRGGEDGFQSHASADKQFPTAVVSKITFSFLWV